MSCPELLPWPDDPHQQPQPHQQHRQPQQPQQLQQPAEALPFRAASDDLSLAAERAIALHWPVFERQICGTFSDRERLGLPEQYVPDRLADRLPAAMRALRHADTADCLAVLGNPAISLVLRHAAGQWLALTGDPRLHALQPDMIEVAGGRVEMGLDTADVDRVMEELAGLGLDRSWIAKECPRHTVTLAPYRIGRFPVTHQEYREFLLDSGQAMLPDQWTYRRFPQELANHPVHTLPASACEAYCAWLSRRTGRQFRLPSEAEWEYAAAGPEGRAYPWGETFDPLRANVCETGLFTTTAVGCFPDGASWCGAQDMAGNVEEYVADTYAPYAGGQRIDDHLSQIHGDYPVARGGSFARFRDLARTRRRHGHNPRSATYVMGFRLAESP